MRAQRISEAEAIKQLNLYREQAINRGGDDVPSLLKDKPETIAFFRLGMAEGKLPEQQSIAFAQATDDIIRTVKSVLSEWYRHRAKQKFAEIAEPWIKHFERYGVQPEGLFIQEMPTRWGSCTAKGKIILNPELIKAPKICIEYVIIHELCHLLHKHHTTSFFNLQSTLMPDWEKWKNKLESLLA